MQDAYDTPYDRYDTPFDHDDTPVDGDEDTGRLAEIDAGLTRIEDSLTRMEGTVEDSLEAKILRKRDFWWAGLALSLEILVGVALVVWWR
jgi:hypothetical protein